MVHTEETASSKQTAWHIKEKKKELEDREHEGKNRRRAAMEYGAL